MSIPRLSDEQLQQARAAAVAARARRAEAKSRLRAGEVRLSTLVAQAAEDDVIAHIKVVDVLRCLPRVGSKRAAEIMARLEIAPNRRLRGLGHHQSQSLVREFG